MEFEPLTAQQLKDMDMIMANFEGTLTPSVCKFKILKAEEKLSKGGNPMMVITTYLTNDQGEAGKLRDWLLTANEFSLYKLDRLFRSIGKVDLLNKKKFEDSDLVNSSGKCRIDYREDNKGNTRLVIEEYLFDAAPVKGPLEKMADSAAVSKELANAESSEEFNDDIPF